MKKCSQTQERRIIIDLHAVRDVYAVHEISNIDFIRGPNNPADGLTKIGKCHALYHLLQTGKCDFTVDQWVLRSWNVAITTKYLSTVPLGYNLSCRSSNIHSWRDITSSYEHLYEHESLQTVPFEMWNCSGHKIATDLYSFMITPYFKKVGV